MARAAHARVAFALRRGPARGGAARGRGLPRGHHRSRPPIDPVLRCRTTTPGVRRPPLVRRRVDGSPDRDGKGGRRPAVAAAVRVPSGPTGAVLAVEAVARDRLPASIERDPAVTVVEGG